MKLTKKIRRIILAIEAALIVVLTPGIIAASDHDDGEVDIKGRTVNLTDLYVYREKDQNSSAADGDLVFTMNTNPRSVARYQYYFSTTALYQFHITQVGDVNSTPTGRGDIILRFAFSPPNNQGMQAMAITVVRGGSQTTTKTTVNGNLIATTPLNSNAVLNTVPVGGSNLTVFAGLREDPFFFDVEQYFRVRAGALGTGPKVGFKEPSKALDFAKGYNVNSITVRVPKAFLQAGTGANTFDVWSTVSVRDGVGGFKQFERLARPAINEGLIVTPAFLEAFNTIPPRLDLSAAAAPVRQEAVATLNAVDLLDGKDNVDANAIAKAFLPDVLRIDTTRPSGYGSAANAQGSLIGGRLLLDDVVDITLGALVGSPVGDNVSYNGTPGNPAQGHKPLEPNFPYLALPN
ncbi:MAG: DUF4331 domain-containing protein [Microcoleus sp. PH2017_10_PVI_O_A]|uniref:DUF4331 domain-containing protein n=1 Tax=unclassified Microcoleus TaxID=2642155 RepID=UPI001E04E477|nr:MULTISPECIES: DUF4331 domain-containing protein [unclassified Microcoleus]TAE74712.1 MAG: DUF4331 domain-containing protein [Oscillatoriales cyanobacterium]MCC3409622.1 DUF4331 domain-containing protein [Microcoleus sp. PH2017_10_PVI_O_A]MCC3463877.1 DUF4331 domain-containing protein [Microcoleus sp. PH2017_11_PCY_U_A]MCC3482223.1 DUF4331 domain-containing protein [Microcoleus sp. PH2017_12_PCY_D_A]MCC3531998.1 DUF4331 domain-containing protein [Microcoleus sp. PH2017_21_RUC_O_A]